MKTWIFAAVGTLLANLAIAQRTPGHTGTLPNPKPHHSIDGGVDGQLEAFFCDIAQQMKVKTILRVQSCKRPDYARVYDAALADSARLDERMVCPEECRPGRRFMVEQRWDCYENKAEVELTWVLLCPMDTRPPRELERPSAEAFMEPMRYARGGRWQPSAAAPRMVNDVDEPLACPSIRFVGFTYEERTDSCDNVDYGPAIRRGDSEAHRWYDSLKCPITCEKSPWTLVYKEWKCVTAPPQSPVIRVEYLLSIACRK